MLLLPSTAGRDGFALAVLRNHARPSRHRGSIVYPPIAGYQVVIGPDYERNGKRDTRAVPVPVSNQYDANLLHAALKRWAERQIATPTRPTPPVICLPAPVQIDDTPRTRQLALFVEEAA